MKTFALWFEGFATIGGMAYFLTGFATCYALYFLYCRYKHKRTVINWRYAGLALGIVAIIFVSIQTQTAYTLAKTTAQEVQDCQREFNAALKNRSAISEENDHWSYVQRTALSEWLRNIILPPPDIAYLRMNDPGNPRVQQWGIVVTTRYSNIVQEAQEKQDAALKIRAEHPLPDPTCGK